MSNANQSLQIAGFGGRALLGLILIVAVLAMCAGCGPTTGKPEGENGKPDPLDPWLYKDRVTGCEYLTTRLEHGLAPRIAADGKTHMGCKGER